MAGSFNPVTNNMLIYDEYPTTRTKGLSTISKTKVLETSSWITTVMYYDEKARPIYVYNRNDYLETTETAKSKLDFVGKVIETTSMHTYENDALPTVAIVDKYYYDHAGRLLKQKQQINSQAEEAIAQNYYDDLGQLIGKGVGGTTLQTSLQNIDYTYNIRGWLKGINDVNNLGADLFSFKLNYNTKEIGSTNALQYNGNISETIWRTANDVSTNKTRAYAYQYDALSRITGADYGIKTTTSFNLASGFDMGIDLYDKNGNIKSLWRDNMANTKIDQLSYTYANAEVSNKLLKVEDSSGSPEGFKNGATLATEYTYDGNGNMLRDYNKGITTNIIYNHLNLPSQITFASGNIQYIYDAIGAKQKKIVTEGTGTTTTIYAGNYIYQNNVLQMISQSEGYLEPNGQGGYDYGYRLKDHLGNIRLTFVDFDHNGSIALSEITEENNYYPFGLKHQGYNFVVNSNVNAVATKFKYNGKELNDELGLDWYDYGARFYDAALGRWHSIDPLSEFYKSWSPYNYAVNSPIRFLDPNGMSVADQFWNNIIEDSDVERSGSEEWEQEMKKKEASQANSNGVMSIVDQANGDNAGLALANAINSMPLILSSGPIPIINPLYGAGAISIDGGANLVGAEVDKGIILMLRGKDIGKYVTYNEIAGGGGTGGSIGGEITRYDFSGGNNNLRLSYLEGFRHKAYGGVNVYGVLGVGIAGSWSEPVNGYRVFGTTFSFGVGLSPFLIDAGYNKGDVTFDKLDL